MTIDVARSVGGRPFLPRRQIVDEKRSSGERYRPRRPPPVHHIGGFKSEMGWGEGETRRRPWERRVGASPPSPTTRRHARGVVAAYSLSPAKAASIDDDVGRGRSSSISNVPKPRGAPLEGLPSRPHARSWEGLVEQNRLSASAKVTEDADSLKLALT